MMSYASQNSLMGSQFYYHILSMRQEVSKTELILLSQLLTSLSQNIKVIILTKFLLSHNHQDNKNAASRNIKVFI